MAAGLSVFTHFGCANIGAIYGVMGNVMIAAKCYAGCFNLYLWPMRAVSRL